MPKFKKGTWKKKKLRFFKKNQYYGVRTLSREITKCHIKQWTVDTCEESHSAASVLLL